MRSGENSSNAGELETKSHRVGEQRGKSKNLVAERNRRHKLNKNMLMLRSLVPNITNMNKATIIVDAVSYIQELQRNKEQLISHLQEFDVDVETGFQLGENSLMEEMTQNQNHAEVELAPINHTKVWMKLVCRNRTGGFAKLMEAMNYLGLEPTDISLTTSGGAAIVSLCVEGIYGQVLEVDELGQFLKQFVDVI